MAPWALVAALLCVVRKTLADITNVTEIECDSPMTDEIARGQHIFFDFANDELRWVTFTDCSSEFDTLMYLLNSSEEDIQSQANNGCGGDDCTDPTLPCDQNDRETFTIQLRPGTYFIELTPFGAGGTYVVEVFCDGVGVPATEEQWQDSGEPTPADIWQPISVYYDNHFIMFGGWDEDRQVRNIEVYMGSATEGPYEIGSSLNWTTTPIDTIYTDTWAYPSFQCDSQCYSTTNAADNAIIYFVPDTHGCDYNVYLYLLDARLLLDSEETFLSRVDLANFYRQRAECSSNTAMCVATNKHDFHSTRTLYIFAWDTLLIYNVSAHTGYFANGFDVNIWNWPACVFDKTGNYIWVTDAYGELYRYSVIDDQVELVQQLGDMRWPRLIQLSDGFIMLHSADGGFILQDSLSLADDIGVACTFPTNDAYNVPMYLDSPVDAVVALEQPILYFLSSSLYGLTLETSHDLVFGDNVSFNVTNVTALSSLNPFALEILVDSPTRNVDITAYLYVISLDETTHVLCYACENQSPYVLNNYTWRSTEAVAARMDEDECTSCDAGLSLDWNGLRRDEITAFDLHFDVLASINDTYDGCASLLFASDVSVDIVFDKCVVGYEEQYKNSTWLNSEVTVAVSIPENDTIVLGDAIFFDVRFAFACRNLSPYLDVLYHNPFALEIETRLHPNTSYMYVINASSPDHATGTATYELCFLCERRIPFNVSDWMDAMHGACPQCQDGLLPNYRQLDSAEIDFTILAVTASNVSFALVEETGPVSTICTTCLTLREEELRYYPPFNEQVDVLIETTDTIVFGDIIVFDISFAFTCSNLSPYLNVSYHNPFALEIIIRLSLDTSYMYIFNASSSDEEGSCYFCSSQIQDIRENDVRLQCSECGDGLSLSKKQWEKGKENDAFEIVFEIGTTAATNVLFTFNTSTTTTAFLSLNACPPGYGTTLNVSSLDCNLCSFNSFSFQVSLDPCVPCNTGYRGILCQGSSDVVVSYNYWVAARNINGTQDTFKPLYNATVNDPIVTALCPPNYCCADLTGCSYFQGYTDQSSGVILCAQGRDVDVPMCGACLVGFSELLGTAQCRDCSGRTWTRWPILVVTSVLTLFVSLYLVFVDARPPSHNVSTTTKKKVLIRDERTGLKQILFKPLLYYLQSLNLLLSTRGIKLWISPVLSVFNLSFEAVGGDDDGICWSDGLDATGEILLNLLVPALITLHLFTPRLFVDAKGNATALCYKRHNVCSRSRYKVPHLAGAALRVLLISISMLLTVCFKFLAVVRIEDEWLMFYSADEQAFGVRWFGGLLGVCLVLCVFVILFLKVQRQDEEQRYSTTSIYSKFVRSYKHECWFWEFVIFSRRFCISCFTALQFVGGDFIAFAFLALLVVYLCLQVHFKPFAYGRVNQVETVCLSLLIAAEISINVAGDGDDFVSWILVLCMIVPFLIALWAVYRTVAASKALKAMDERDLHIDAMDKVLQRNPRSLKDVLAQNTRKGNMKSLSTRNHTGAGHTETKGSNPPLQEGVEMSPRNQGSSTLRRLRDGGREAKVRAALSEYFNYDADTLQPFHVKRAVVFEMVNGMNQETEHKAPADAAIGVELWKKIHRTVATPDEIELGNFLAFRHGTTAEEANDNISDDSGEEATPSVTCSNSLHPSQDSKKAGCGNDDDAEAGVDDAGDDVVVGNAEQDEAESDDGAKEPNCDFED